MSAAREIAKALGGSATVDGGFLVHCPVQNHGRGRGDRRPSLSVADGERGLVVNCFAGCHPLDVKAELRARGLIEGGDHRPTANLAIGPRRARNDDKLSQLAHEPDPEAVPLWRHAQPDGDLVRTYLRGRGISLAVPPTLREGRNAYKGRTPLPCMVAAVQAADRRVVAVQSTLLTWNGRKSPVTSPKITTGRLGGGAVRLGPASDVLGIAEGIETALSAMELWGVSVWASLGGQRLAKLDIPPEVRELHIFGDNDAAGRLAAEMAAGHYTRRGLRVVLRWPPDPFKDFNDLLQAQAREVAA